MIYLSPHPMPKILAGLPADLACPNVLADKKETHQNLTEPNADSILNRGRHP